MPPATAMWLSLIRIASSSPKRWLKPPPQRTAYFSSARSPGVVLRVQQMRVLSAGLADVGVGGGGDAGQVLHEIERHALARQNGASVAIDVHQHGFGVDRGAIAHRGHDLDLGRKLAEASGGERQPRDGAGLPRHHDGAAWRAGWDGGDRRDVAGAAEILGQRPRDRVLDLQRRDKAAGIEQGLFDQGFRRPCQHGCTPRTSYRSCARLRGGPSRQSADRPRLPLS